MSYFFSLLSSGDGRVYYFSPEQRIAGTRMPDGCNCFFDSHASIAEFYGLNEDEYNRWTYNPFSEQLVLNAQNAADDREAVLEEVAKINFGLVCGDIEGAREFIKHLGGMKFLDKHGDVPDDVKMFETISAAYDAAGDAARDAAQVTAWEAAWTAADDAARDAARDTARDAVWSAARVTTWEAAWKAVWNASWDALKNAALVIVWEAAKNTAWNAASDTVYDVVLFIRLIYVCSGLPIDQKHIDYIKKRWSVWEAGYGVSRGVNGVLYCYKNQ